MIISSFFGGDVASSRVYFDKLCKNLVFVLICISVPYCYRLQLNLRCIAFHLFSDTTPGDHLPKTFGFEKLGQVTKYIVPIDFEPNCLSQVICYQNIDLFLISKSLSSNSKNNEKSSTRDQKLSRNL